MLRISSVRTWRIFPALFGRDSCFSFSLWNQARGNWAGATCINDGWWRHGSWTMIHCQVSDVSETDFEVAWLLNTAHYNSVSRESTPSEQLSELIDHVLFDELQRPLKVTWRGESVDLFPPECFPAKKSDPKSKTQCFCELWNCAFITDNITALFFVSRAVNDVVMFHPAADVMAILRDEFLHKGGQFSRLASAKGHKFGLKISA